MTEIPIVIGVLGTIAKGLVKRRVEIIQTTALLRSRQNTEKSPGDLGRLAVSQTPVNDHQLILV